MSRRSPAARVTLAASLVVALASTGEGCPSRAHRPLAPACLELQRLDIAEWWAWQARDTAAVVAVLRRKIAALDTLAGPCPLASPERFAAPRTRGPPRLRVELEGRGATRRGNRP